MLFTNNDENILKKFLKKEEKHHNRTISFYELFLLCRDRFVLIENELYDLSRLLKHHFNINNIVFKENLEGDMSLIIDFNDDKREYLVLTMESFNDINISLDTTNGKYNKLIDYAKPIIIKSFNKESNLSISKTYYTNSSTKIFDIKTTSNELNLSYNSKTIDIFFKLNYLFDIDKIQNSDILKYFECKTNYIDIKRELEDLNKLKIFLENIQINEEDIPRILIKK